MYLWLHRLHYITFILPKGKRQKVERGRCGHIVRCCHISQVINVGMEVFTKGTFLLFSLYCDGRRAHRAATVGGSTAEGSYSKCLHETTQGYAPSRGKLQTEPAFPTQAAEGAPDHQPCWVPWDRPPTCHDFIQELTLWCQEHLSGER